MMTDPIADMLARLRNAGMARHAKFTCPASKQKLAIANVLKAEGFLDEVVDGREDKKRTMTLSLRYQPDGRTMIEGLRRVSTPGRRVYVPAGDIPRVRNGLGIAVLSTSKGVICDRDAREQGIGGEVICEVW